MGSLFRPFRTRKGWRCLGRAASAQGANQIRSRDPVEPGKDRAQGGGDWLAQQARWGCTWLTAGGACRRAARLESMPHNRPPGSTGSWHDSVGGGKLPHGLVSSTFSGKNLDRDCLDGRNDRLSAGPGHAGPLAQLLLPAHRALVALCSGSPFVKRQAWPTRRQSHPSRAAESGPAKTPKV